MSSDQVKSKAKRRRARSKRTRPTDGEPVEVRVSVSVREWFAGVDVKGNRASFLPSTVMRMLDKAVPANAPAATPASNSGDSLKIDELAKCVASLVARIDALAPKPASKPVAAKPPERLDPPAVPSVVEKSSSKRGPSPTNRRPSASPKAKNPKLDKSH